MAIIQKQNISIIDQEKLKTACKYLVAYDYLVEIFC